MLHLRTKWGPGNEFADDISTDSMFCSSTDSSSSDSDTESDSSEEKPFGNNIQSNYTR